MQEINIDFNSKIKNIGIFLGLSILFLIISIASIFIFTESEIPIWLLFALLSGISWFKSRYTCLNISRKLDKKWWFAIVLFLPIIGTAIFYFYLLKHKSEFKK